MSTTPDTTIAYMVRCKCGAAARVTVPAVRVPYQHKVFSVVGVAGSAIFETRHRKEERFEAESFLHSTLEIVWRGCRANCWACGMKLKIDRVKGTYKPEHKCDARCLASKGPNCECACGGTNHGKNWES
jgi:hypothetical protein